MPVWDLVQKFAFELCVSVLDLNTQNAPDGQKGSFYLSTSMLCLEPCTTLRIAPSSPLQRYKSRVSQPTSLIKTETGLEIFSLTNLHVYEI